MAQPKQAQAQPVTQAAEGRREGSRWINRRPTGEELAAWFRDNVAVHEGLKHDPYIPGVLVIEQKEKVRSARMNPETGQTLIIEEEQLVYVPHVGVSARVRYWNDWLALDEQADAVGVLEVVDPAEPAADLPPGFWWYRVPKTATEIVNFVGLQVRPGLYQKDSLVIEPVATGFASVVRVLEGIPIRKWPPGTKVVASLNRWGEDANAIMKAETGAVGRALAFAGMLVIPGAGLATAEDMHEAIANEGAGATPVTTAQPQLPSEAPPAEASQSEAGGRADEREWIREKLAELQSVAPEAYEDLVKWSTDKKTVDLDKPTDTQLRGLRRQIERRLPEAV